MTSLPESRPAGRTRVLVLAAVAAMVVLGLMAVLAVVAFVRLELVAAPELVPGASRPPLVAPEPTLIGPELFAPPNAWLDEVG